jgi:hypothetical protein
MEHSLNYEYSEWESLGSDADKERVCTNLLKLSDMWQIIAGRLYAISVLETMDLPPSRRLDLAGKFTITHWVEPAVRKILNGKLVHLSDGDVCAMGWKVYSILAKAFEKLEEETRRTAFVPPMMGKDPSYECKNHSSCLSVWPKLWFDKIGRNLLHAIAPIRLNEIHAKVANDETFRHSGLSEPCRVDMVSYCANLGFADEGIIVYTTEQIVNYQKSL